ncbi:MAG TPA: ChbG/HpnK family deacetylase [Methylomirabilota bacterium]
MSGGPARRLIVNADDFGLTEGVSRGILRAHREGLVTSTTVLASLPAQPEADAAAAASGLGLGLHFNLTWARPVSPAGTVASLVDGEGRFGRDLAALQARARPDEVRRECEAQIEAFTRRFGRGPTHLDSHHHVHRVPGVLDAVVDVVLGARLPLRSQDAGFREGLRRHGIATTDAFVGDARSEPYWTTERLLDQLATLPLGLTELMCHPGYFDESLAYSRYGRQREVELAALCDGEARATVERLDIGLCHFGALHAGG